ncbi:MAG: hypothetical protein M3Y74_15905, partial [Chloroflexota bacterium]|nr:hypothetical protein [Chloroflexota bacterium]
CRLYRTMAARDGHDLGGHDRRDRDRRGSLSRAHGSPASTSRDEAATRVPPATTYPSPRERRMERGVGRRLVLFSV